MSRHNWNIFLQQKFIEYIAIMRVLEKTQPAGE